MKLLIPMQPESPRKAAAAIDTAIQLFDQHGAQVHLLSVQPRISGHVAMCFGPGELRRIHEEAAREELLAARTVLDAARVPYTCRLAVGLRAQSIAEVAQELRCDRILLGAQARPVAGGRLFGSLAQQLRHLLGGAAGCEVIGS